MSRQRGVALMLLMLLAGVGALAVFVTGLNRAAVQLERDKLTAAALAQAKEALTGRAVGDGNRPGSLPCPDRITNVSGNVPNDGVADLLSGNDCPSYIGRLPWRTLRLPDLRDGNGERLWYALSSNFRDDDSALINSSTQGVLSITGSVTATQVIAVVFAPGAPLTGQQRDGSNENLIGNYLEDTNATSNTDFVAGNATDTFNDRLMPILHGNLLPNVERRVAGEFKLNLSPPYPNSLTSPPLASPPWPAWLLDANWSAVAVYNQLSVNKATMIFPDCPSQIFTIEWNSTTGRNELSRAGSC